MPSQPDEPLERSVKPIQKKVRHSNHQQCLPAGSKQQEAGSVDKNVDKARDCPFRLVQCHPVRLEKKKSPKR